MEILLSDVLCILIMKYIEGKKFYVNKSRLQGVKTRRQVLEECNSYIKEYLERNQLLRTTREFERECAELRLPLPKILSGKVLYTLPLLST